MKKLLLLFAALCCTAMMQAEIVHHAQCDPTYRVVGYTQECWEDTETGKLYAEQGCTTELNRAIVVTYKKLRKNPIVNLGWRSDMSRVDTYLTISQNESETLGDCPFCWNAKFVYSDDYSLYDAVYGVAEFKALGSDIANARLKCYWNSYNTTNTGTLHTGNDDAHYTLTIKIGDQVVYEKNRDSRWGDMPHVFEVPLPGLKIDDVVTFEMCKGRNYPLPGEYAACLEYTSTNGGDPDAAAIKTDDKRKFKGTDDPELTYTVTPASLAENVSGINVSRDVGEELGFYTIHASQAEGANPDNEIFLYDDGKLEIVDGVHHAKGDVRTDGLIYIQDCWEETATGKYYADDYLEHEIGAGIYAVVGYPEKLKENPVTATDGFTVKESATYDGVPFNWEAETQYSSHTDTGTRSVEFTAIEFRISSARLKWYIDHGEVGYGPFTVTVYVNNNPVECYTQNNGESLTGFHAVSLPGLKRGDIVKLEVQRPSVANWAGAPLFAACLEYMIPHELFFMAQEAGSTVQLNKVGTPYDASLEYSTTGTTWQTYTFGQTITLASKGDRVYFRNANDDLTKGFSKGYMSDYYQFAMTGSIAAGGNVMSLLDKTCKSTAFPYDDGNVETPEDFYYFVNLFSGCTSLTSAPELPATKLTPYCYMAMFNGCTGLTEAPALPATTLSGGCYTAMFDNCTGLTEVPVLPATTVAVNCYESVFRGCTSLIEAPELPAMTMESNCYREMFSGCTSLETAPALPATTLAQQCYLKMFNGCTSLTAAPELPATTVEVSCYESMFNGCTSLTAAPELPATALARSCYERMFYGCTKLNQVKVGFTKWGNMEDSYGNDYRATSDWLNGTASTGTFVCPDALDKTKTGVSYIPEGWTPVFEVKANNEPETENCYATFYSGTNAYQVPEDVTAYTGVVEESVSNPDVSVLRLTAIKGGIIPADEPVILKGTQTQIYLSYTTSTTATKSDNNALTGTDVAKTLGTNDYALSKGTNGVGFYQWSGKTIGANKAYLTLPGSLLAPGRSFDMMFDDVTVTGIPATILNQPQYDVIYNLQGQKVDKNYKGLIIKNGQKIFNR